MSKTCDLFISYRTARAAEVAPLIAALEARGVTVWQDVKRVDHGASISDAVRAGLASSRALLAYWSADYPESRICLWELTLANVLAERAGSPSTRVGLLCAPGVGFKDVTGPIKDSKAFSTDDGVEATANQIQSWLAGLRGANGDQRRLGELGPVGGVPWLPQRRVGSTRFVGREKELWALHGHLRAGEHVVISGRPTAQAQLRGMAGLGKSLTALEYANRFEAAWPGGIFVLDAGEYDPGRVLGELASAIGVPDDVPPLERAHRARRILEAKAEPYLWMVDNLPPGLTQQQAEAWLAPGAKGATLFTTRGRGLNALGRSIDLDVLSEVDALRLLRGPDALSGEEDAEAKALLDQLGRLPLAVDVLRALIERDQRAGRTRPYRRWLGRIARPDKEDLDLADALLRSESLPTETSKNVAALLFAAMEGLSPGAWDVLRVCAALADAPVPIALVESAVRRADKIDPQTAEDHVDGGVDELWGRSLVQAKGGALRLHALVRRVAARQDPDLARVGALAAETLTALGFALGNVLDARTHAVSATLVPHIEQLLAGEWDVPRAELAMVFAMREGAAGRFPEARRRYERALDVQTRLLGAENLDTLSTRQNLANTLKAQGDLAGARWHYEASLEARIRLLGEEHLETLTCLQNFAGVLLAQGEFAAARLLFERAFESRARQLGAEHPDTLATLQNLASTLKAQGDVAAARRLEERALETQARVLGRDHPQTLSALQNLATTLAAQGDVAGARRLLEQALETQTRVLGPDHPNTLGTLQNLAVTLKAQGDLASAGRLENTALEAQTRVLGADHPDTLTTLQNLANTIAAQGDLAGAQRLGEQALEGQTRVLGEEHPNTLSTFQNLAVTLKAQGDLTGARRLEERVLEARTRLLGTEHPHTLSTLLNLAVTLKDQGDFAGARRRYEQALEAMTRLLGTEHPDTQVTTFNLLFTLRQLGSFGTMVTHINALRPLLDADPATLSASQRHIRAHLPAIIAALDGT
jgi:tetratricopeptide (TPR) repeat protein